MAVVLNEWSWQKPQVRTIGKIGDDIVLVYCNLWCAECRDSDVDTYLGFRVSGYPPPPIREEVECPTHRRAEAWVDYETYNQSRLI